MRTRHMFIAIGVALGLCSVGSEALAATSASSSKQPTNRPGARSRLPGAAPQGRAGRVMGNRLTRTYDPPGSSRQMPPARYRVYFTSAKAAKAAGYHPVDWHPGQVISEIKTKMQPHDLPHQPFRRQQPDTAPTNPAPGP